MKEILPLLEKCLDFLSDKSKKTAHKISWIAIVLFILLLFNDYAGCAFYLSNESKLNQVQKIDEILKDTTLSKDIRSGLITLRQETFYRRSFLLSVIKEITSSTEKVIIINKATNEVKTISINFYWEIITSAWIILLVMCIIPFKTNIMMVGKYKLIKKWIYVIFVEILLALGAIVIAYIFSRIPIIDDNPVYNYLINVTSTFVILTAVGMSINKKKAKAANAIKK